MEKYIFANDGYKCCDVDGSILYESHKYDLLFDFVAASEMNLDTLLDSYINNYIDLKTFELTGNQANQHIWFEMERILFSMHEFFLFSSCYLSREVAEYFNDCLLFDYFNYDESKRVIQSEEWYKERFTNLIPESSEQQEDYVEGIYFGDFYQDYLNKANFLVDYYPLPPNSFKDLKSAKINIGQMLFWILDVNNPFTKALNIKQRQTLYGELFLVPDLKMTSVTTEYYHLNIDNMAFDHLHSRHSTIKVLSENGDHEYIGNALSDYHDTGSFGKYPNAKEALIDLIDNIMERKHALEFFPVYAIDKIYTLLFIEFQKMLENEVHIKKCRNCGKYFTDILNFEYCERFVDATETSTCRDVGPKNAYKKKLHEDPALLLYTKSYRTHHARIGSKNKNGAKTKKSMSLNEFEDWASEARQKLDSVRKSEITLADFETWLKNH